MGAYSFDRFRRDGRNTGTLPLPFRLYAWMAGVRMPYQIQHRRAIAEFTRVVDAIGAVLSPNERADPRTITTSRRLEIAMAAKLSDDELTSIFYVHDGFAKMAPDRTKLWWQWLAVYIIVFVGVPLLILTAGALLFFLLTAIG